MRRLFWTCLNPIAHRKAKIVYNFGAIIVCNFGLRARGLKGLYSWHGICNFLYFNKAQYLLNLFPTPLPCPQHTTTTQPLLTHHTQNISVPSVGYCPIYVEFANENEYCPFLFFGFPLSLFSLFMQKGALRKVLANSEDSN